MTAMFGRTLLVAVAARCLRRRRRRRVASGGPPREGTSAEWADAWTAVATEECGGQCAVFEAVDGETPAADAEPANFTCATTRMPTRIGGVGTVEDFGAAARCVLPCSSRST